MKKVFYKKILPAIISISMVLAICVPNGSLVTAYGGDGHKASSKTVQSKDITDEVTPDTGETPNPGETTDPEVKPNPENPDSGEVVDPNVPVEPENPEPGETPEPNVPVDPENPDNPDEPTEPEAPLDISKVQIKLSKTEYLYTGKELTPTVKVTYKGKTYKKNVDFTVTYVNAKLPGTATVVVKGIGQLAGTKYIKYKINLPKAKIKKVTTPGHGMNKIYWESVDDITGYAISRSTERDGEYKNLAYLGKDYTSWTDKKATVPKVYYYRVRTFKDINGKRYFSPKQVGYAMKTRLTATTKLRVESVDFNTLEIKWNKVEGATGYMVYRNTTQKGEYDRVKTLKGNSNTEFKNTGLKTGKRYYYKIIAYKGNTNNPGLISNYYYGEPNLEKAHWNKNGIRKYTNEVRLSWHKVNGATGYEIYKYSKSQGKYVLRDRVGMDYRVYTDRNLNQTSKYSYKIRACRMVDGVRYHGPFSSVYKKVPQGWIEKNGYKLYYNKNGELVKDLRVMLGRQPSYWLKVNKQMNVVNVFARDGSGKYKIPVVAFRCSSGKSTPLGTFYTPAKYRWHELMGPSWGQWNTRIHQGFLFHSVYYLEENDNKSLPVNTYNRLGQTESHGCVRLRAGDAKWIYDNCALGTKVTIYKSDNPGPYGKPPHELLPYWHTWDPTDPTAFKYCRAHHCHGK